MKTETGIAGTDMHYFQALRQPPECATPLLWHRKSSSVCILNAKNAAARTFLAFKMLTNYSFTVYYMQIQEGKP